MLVDGYVSGSLSMTAYTLGLGGQVTIDGPGAAEFPESVPVDGSNTGDRAYLVEAAVEAVLLAVAGVQVAVGPAGAAVVVVDGHREVARAEPLDDELGVGVGPEDLLGGRIELAGDADQGNGRVGDDLGGAQ